VFVEERRCFSHRRQSPKPTKGVNKSKIILTLELNDMDPAYAARSQFKTTMFKTTASWRTSKTLEANV
jgi:hypothetical protein